MNVAEIAELMASRDRLLAVFTQAAQFRSLRQELIDEGAEAECGWQRYERHVMLAEVNRQRRGVGLPPADEAAVGYVERQACGHSDYAAKWALYCAELATGLLDPATGRPL